MFVVTAGVLLEKDLASIGERMICSPKIFIKFIAKAMVGWAAEDHCISFPARKILGD